MPAWSSLLRIGVPALLVASLSPLEKAPAQEAAEAAGDVRLYHLMDAIGLRGEQIRLRVAIRSGDASGGTAAFGWLQLDGPPAEGPGPEQRTARVSSPEWSVEEVRAVVPADAIDLLFGVGVDGTGPIWADDVQLAILKPSGVWRRLAIPNADFESVAQGGRPADWGGIDPGWEARVDRDYPYEGSGALRLERSAGGPGSR
jgi:hypothetical protein